jgi:hypothetical protein
VKTNIEADGFALNSDSVDVTNLCVILESSQNTVTQLKDIIRNFRGLRRQNQARNWERLKLQYKNIGELRGRLTSYVTELSAYLGTVSISALDRVELRLHDLPYMVKAINKLGAEIRAGRREGSVMTSYENDDQDVWRQFRRELIGEGFTSNSVKMFKTNLKIHLRKWSEAGLLKEEPPDRPNKMKYGDNRLRIVCFLSCNYNS